MENTVVDNQKKNYITLLNVCAAFAVVFLHVNNNAFNTYPDFFAFWPTANVIRAIFYFAVPVFFMMSGANLLDYNLRYSTKVYAIKRVNKVFIPFLFWSFLGFVYYINVENPAFDLSVCSFISGLINCWYVGTYWFFIPLFLVYLAIPLFAAVSQEKKITYYTYFVLLGMVINVLIPFLIKIFHIEIYFGITFEPVGGYMLYVLLGYLLDRVDIKRVYRLIIYAFGLLGLLLDIIGTYQETISSGQVSDAFTGYLNLPAMLYSVAIYVLFKYGISNIMNNEKIAAAIRWLSAYSFGIYLVHRAIYAFLYEAVVRYCGATGRFINASTIGFEIIIFLLVILLCIPFIMLMRKIPILKHMIP